MRHLVCEYYVELLYNNKLNNVSMNAEGIVFFVLCN